MILKWIKSSVKKLHLTLHISHLANTVATSFAEQTDESFEASYKLDAK